MATSTSTSTSRSRSRALTGTVAVAAVAGTLLLGGIAPAQAQESALHVSAASPTTQSEPASYGDAVYVIRNLSDSTLTLQSSFSAFLDAPDSIAPGAEAPIEMSRYVYRTYGEYVYTTSSGDTVTLRLETVPFAASCSAVIGKCHVESVWQGTSHPGVIEYRN
jgi:hypothetical protein